MGTPRHHKESEHKTSKGINKPTPTHPRELITMGFRERSAEQSLRLLLACNQEPPRVSFLLVSHEHAVQTCIEDATFFFGSFSDNPHLVVRNVVPKLSSDQWCCDLHQYVSLWSISLPWVSYHQASHDQSLFHCSQDQSCCVPLLHWPACATNYCELNNASTKKELIVCAASRSVLSAKNPGKREKTHFAVIPEPAGNVQGTCRVNLRAVLVLLCLCSCRFKGNKEIPALACGVIHCTRF